jgi:hypothetical protein
MVDLFTPQASSVTVTSSRSSVLLSVELHNLGLSSSQICVRETLVQGSFQSVDHTLSAHGPRPTEPMEI